MYRRIGALIFIAGLFWSCHREVTYELDALELNPNTRLARDVRILYSDSARLRLMMSSPILEWTQEGEDIMVFFPTVHIEFFDQTETKVADLYSKRATRYPDRGLVVVEDSVRLIHVNGDQLESSLLNWDEKEQRAYTDRFVKITKDTERFFGFGFEAQNNFKTFSITKLTGKMKLDQ